MLPDPGLFIVHDPEDKLENMQFLRDVTDGDARKLFVPISPGADNNKSVGNDFLRALGKDSNLLGAGRNATEMWQRACLWMEVGGLEDVYVSRAHLLPLWLLEEVARLAFRANARLWLIFQTAALTRPHERFVANWPFTELQWPEFAKRWSNPIPTGRQQNPVDSIEPQAERLPEVPLDDFTSFRASCRKLLDPPGFASVDAEFLSTFERTRAYLEAQRSPSETAICEHVRELISDVDWMPTVLTRVRGSQVAAFHAGYLMKVQLDVLSATRVSRIVLDEESLRLLDKYATARFGASAMLVAATGCQLDDILAMDLRDVGEGATVVRVAGRDYRLPERAAAMVEVLVRERLARRAGPDDPLFVYVEGTGRRHNTLHRWTDRGMYDNLKKMERETGLLLTSHLRDAGQRNAVNWAHRRGISIQRIGA
jgi:integrase